MLIAAGLVILIAAGNWPLLPAVTGMALVVLGATLATVERFQGTPALVPVLFAHVAIYGGLVALFVGASLHRAAESAGGAGWRLAIDLALSIVPLAATILAVFDALRQSHSAE
jgi:hypothetical protein